MTKSNPQRGEDDYPDGAVKGNHLSSGTSDQFVPGSTGALLPYEPGSFTPADEARLLAIAQGGDQEKAQVASWTLFLFHRMPIYNAILYGLRRSGLGRRYHDAAVDILHDVAISLVIRLMVGKIELEPGNSLRGYIYRAAMHKVSQFLKEHGESLPFPEELLQALEDNPALSWDALLRDDEVVALASERRREPNDNAAAPYAGNDELLTVLEKLYQELEQAGMQFGTEAIQELERLSQRKRDFLILHILGLGNTQIASSFDTTEGNVKTHVCLARKILRQRLASRWAEQGLTLLNIAHRLGMKIHEQSDSTVSFSPKKLTLLLLWIKQGDELRQKERDK